MLQNKIQNSTTEKVIINDESSFLFAAENNINNLLLQIFDETEMQSKLSFYLKVLQHFCSKPEVNIEISSNSALILISIPILKKLKNLQLIELTARRGKRPEEIIKTAKTLRGHGLLVKVKYLRK